MDHTYAPWRKEYVTAHKKDDECVLCRISKNHENDQENFVIYRDNLCYVVMNRFPYNPGHLMVVPHKHEGSLETLDSTIWLHIANITQKSAHLIKDAMNAHGINLGMNIDKAGGAGIDQHVHMHIVPRWYGDTNFITTIGNTRVYPTDFYVICDNLRKLVPQYF
jgi:diadenosine tetraphosphate (Ap4A) HIT family hydrolase